METTDREDIGTDLNSPQTAEKGKPTPGYFLMTAVRPGDVVFHYRRSQGAIVAWS